MSRDRERQLEPALKHELRAAGTPDRDACLDAETLGAWTEGGLETAQMAAVELHVSTCARCQAIVAATVRSVPPNVGERAQTVFSWRWWFAPVAAAAAAVTLWMVVPRDRDVYLAPSSVATPAKDTLAQSEPKEQAKVADERRAAPAAAETSPAGASPSGASAVRQQPRADRRERPAEPVAKAEGFAAKKQEDEARTLPATRNTTADATAPAVLPPPPVAPPPAPPAPAAAAAAPLERAKIARFSAAPVEIVSPDASLRWRIVNGAIERSQDAGASWIVVRPASGESITGGMAPAGSICWIIGTGGLVLVTVDGALFLRVPVSERVDLTAVTATDARTAVVTAADGRRFRTDDGGRNWRVY
jgi:hypothetical protein